MGSIEFRVVMYTSVSMNQAREPACVDSTAWSHQSMNTSLHPI